MITAQHTFTAPPAYPLERLGRPDKLLFFDIETTGFSGGIHQVYLIGCTYRCGGVWNLIQWFADTPEAEKEVLTAFLRFTEDFSGLVHFNGDTFDIPFLLKRFHAWDLSWDPGNLSGTDIYKRIRPLKNLLGLDSLKQKAVEQFLGIFRQDPYSGGQLIDVYRLYLETRKDSLLHMLMLHNREDLEGMPLILPILYYADLPGQDFTLVSQQVLETPDIFGEPSFSLELTLENPDSLPVPVLWDTPRASCEAVQNSVGEYVERKARRKATAQTCYTRKTALFLPQPDTLWAPAFRKDYRSRQLYGEYTPDRLTDQKNLAPYIRYLLDM